MRKNGNAFSRLLPVLILALVTVLPSGCGRKAGLDEKLFSSLSHVPRPLPPPEKRTGRNVDPVELLAEAGSMALEVEDPNRGGKILIWAARQLSIYGFNEQALELLYEAPSLAARIKDPSKRRDLIWSARREAARAGDIEPAINIIEETVDSPDADETGVPRTLWGPMSDTTPRWLLAEVVILRLVAEGERERAELLLAADTRPPDAKARLMARVLAWNGYGLEALDLLRNSDLKFALSPAGYPGIQAKGGDIGGAVETARAMEDNKAFYEAVGEVAAEQIRGGDPVGAVKMIKAEIHPFPDRNVSPEMSAFPVLPEQIAWISATRTIDEAVRKLADSGFPDEARLLLEGGGRITNDYTRAHCLSRISIAHLAKGEDKQARKAAEAALKEADRIAGGAGRINAFAEAGKALAAAGKLEKARRVLAASAEGFETSYKSMKDNHHRDLTFSYALGRMMAGEENAGKALVEEILESIDPEKHPHLRESIRQAVIEFLLARGDVAGAVERARSATNLQERARLLMRVGYRMLDIWGPG